jgi:hypothetical protein
VLCAAPELIMRMVHAAAVVRAARRKASPSAWGAAEFSNTCRV